MVTWLLTGRAGTEAWDPASGSSIRWEGLPHQGLGSYPWWGLGDAQ